MVLMQEWGFWKYYWLLHADGKTMTFLGSEPQG
jgi:hypothetical protein